MFGVTNSGKKKKCLNMTFHVKRQTCMCVVVCQNKIQKTIGGKLVADID